MIEDANVVIAVEGGRVIAVYTDMDLIVAVNDHDEGGDEQEFPTTPLREMG